MNFAEKRLIKEKSLRKNLRQRIEKARYNFFKEIKEQGSVLKARAKQEQELKEFINSLRSLNLSYVFIKSLEREVHSFVKNCLGGIQQ